ncbi:NADH-ubiquinone oxidoreductase 14.8 kDa subunit [Ceratocystis lukuohia]|uniref:NADH-ubiquinone oxidoreductase 14.8 kDa subunit n=1 Tax=Ceratocystis lukuohia TaxID=2019550 RepID=A0ABR4MEE7_9PEZI
MAVLPTELAVRVRQSVNWSDAKLRVIHAYRDWMRAAPTIQTMYNVPKPVPAIRTRIREEFEKNRFINKINHVDVLVTKSNAEYQETMNFWKQTPHIMSYFKDENWRADSRLPSNFMSGFLEFILISHHA